MSKDVNDSDVFSFNDAFTSKLHKVKIGMVSAQKESEPEKTDTRHKASTHIHNPPASIAARQHNALHPVWFGLPLHCFCCECPFDQVVECEGLQHFLTVEHALAFY